MTRISRLQSPDSLQARLHESILEVGGYWRPLAAVARVLEELGELADAMAGDSDAIASEVADLWIITTCLATQYCIDVPDPQPPGGNREEASSYQELVSMAGGIARVVNYYDGPKNPRAIAGWIPLWKRIPQFHRGLSSFAQHCTFDLADAVAQKLTGMTRGEQGRFAAQYDPSCADSAMQFEEILRGTRCLYANGARIWGAPNWSPTADIAANVAALAQHLLSFVKCAVLERLDGFILMLPDENTAIGFDGLVRTLNAVLRGLCAVDPTPNATFAGDVDIPGWQFQFAGARLFVSVFSPEYDRRHPRHASRSPFIFFQPEAVFDMHGIGGIHQGSHTKKRAVRDAFKSAGYWYPDELIDARVEADIYILPPRVTDPPVVWWR